MYRRLSHLVIPLDIGGLRCLVLGVMHLSISKKIKSPAWNSLDEVIRDICSEFWTDVFGVESASLHTESAVLDAPSG